MSKPTKGSRCSSVKTDVASRSVQHSIALDSSNSVSSFSTGTGSLFIYSCTLTLCTRSRVELLALVYCSQNESNRVGSDGLYRSFHAIFTDRVVEGKFGRREKENLGEVLLIGNSGINDCR